jgi:hypothetical protein
VRTAPGGDRFFGRAGGIRAVQARPRLPLKVVAAASEATLPINAQCRTVQALQTRAADVIEALFDRVA